MERGGTLNPSSGCVFLGPSVRPHKSILWPKAPFWYRGPPPPTVPSPLPMGGGVDARVLSREEGLTARLVTGDRGRPRAPGGTSRSKDIVAQAFIAAGLARALPPRQQSKSKFNAAGKEPVGGAGDPCGLPSHVRRGGRCAPRAIEGLEDLRLVVLHAGTAYPHVHTPPHRYCVPLLAVPGAAAGRSECAAAKSLEFPCLEPFPFRRLIANRRKLTCQPHVGRPLPSCA